MSIAVILPNSRAVVMEQSLLDLLFVEPEVAALNLEDGRYRGAITGEVVRMLSKEPLCPGQMLERMSVLTNNKQSVYSVLNRLKKTGRAERFRNPDTGLWQWRLKGGKA